jgi:MFS transporter, PPP family, 3-phenylpropionic acid transporter
MTGKSQIPTAPQPGSRRFALRLSLFYGALFGLLGTHLPFFPVWLRAIGIEASWIGIITAVPAVTRFTVLPIVVGVAERRRAARGALVLAAFVTAVGFAIVGTQHGALSIFLFYVATCCLWTPMIPLTDAYALQGIVRFGLNYGRMRLWGSAAFIAGALACGLLAMSLPLRS